VAAYSQNGGKGDLLAEEELTFTIVEDYAF